MKAPIKTLFASALLLVFLLAVVSPVLAQAELTLRVSKDFGYNSGSKIRGTFTLSATGPEDLASVVFFIDGQEVGRAGQSPFRLQIKTDDYPSGEHSLEARGTKSDGSSLVAQARTFQFLSREEEASGMKNILIPMLGILALITVGGMALQMLTSRGSHPQPSAITGKFTYHGGSGAICPRCQMPTPVHAFSPNIGLMTKFDRCESCGKWSLMRVRPAREMEAYARALVSQDQPQIQAEDEGEKLRKQVDDSRFME